MDRRLCAAAARTRLDRGSHRRDRVSLGGGTHRAFSRDRGRVRPAQGRCHCHVVDRRHIAAASRRHRSSPSFSRSAGDPVGTGLVASLARPGGNVTGLSIQSTDLAAKRLELLREVVPGLRRLAIMANVGNPEPCWKCARSRQRPARSASRSLQLEIRRAEDIAPAFEASRAAPRHFML